MRSKAVVMAIAVAGVYGQRLAGQADSVRPISRLAPITVSATRLESPVFQVVSPVLVVDSAVFRRDLPNGIGDLFRNLPGVDVTGVGPNQGRLMIRGQRGQRILLAEDGLRMNNARRQQDFGELPSITDVNALSRVEVVRGPASVLYGTDAIGGVVNEITFDTPGSAQRGITGSALYRTSSADRQNLGHFRLSGREGHLGVLFSVGLRDAGNYSAPAGSFGRLTFPSSQRVNDVGVRDRNLGAKLSYAVGENAQVALKYSHYGADDAGFGYVDPKALGDSSGVVVRLLYPEQRVDRLTASYRASALSWGFANRVTFTTTAASNTRTFNQQIDIPFGAPLPPNAGMAIRTYNYTDINSFGARLELAKILHQKHSLVYGADWYLDNSLNTDSSTTTTTVFGPPTARRSTTPAIPNASYATAGLFAQLELAIAPRLMVGAGARAQAIRSSTRSTAGLPENRAGVTSSNSTLVGNISTRYSVSSNLNLVATVGRAFRAPNLIERYFDGATPEGNGYQVANPALGPESSLNVDVGAKLRSGRLYAEITFFSNAIHDGIRIVPVDTVVGTFPGYQNQNIAKLRDRGVEALAQVNVGWGIALLAHATTLTSKHVDRSNPIGDSYGSKLGGELTWRDPRSRVVLGYEVRHQGVRKEIDLGTSPVGAELPAFTVHAARASVRLRRVGRAAPELDLALNNLTNQLYAEASNTAFFRPEPGRSLTTALRVDF